MKIFLSNEAIDELKSHTSNDGTRYNLAGIWVDTETKKTYATDGHRLATRLVDCEEIDQRAPDFEAVLASETGSNEKTNAYIFVGKNSQNDLLKALKRFDKSETLRVEITKHGLEISVNTDGNETTVKYNCETEVIGDNATIGIKCQYLLDSLKSLLGSDKGQTVKIEISGSLDPVSLTCYDDKKVNVIMPVRLD